MGRQMESNAVEELGPLIRVVEQTRVGASSLLGRRSD